MNTFINNLIKKNTNFHYHLITIVLFSVLYYQLSIGKLVGKEDKQFDNYGSALYYTIVTHFTIGYGDISPKGTILRILCCIQIIIAFLITNL
jgi:hypothetical protein